MRWGGWLAIAGAALIGGCSWVPFLGVGDPHLTNAAVEACKDKADDLGYEGAGERESAPLGDGRYSVVLDIRQNEGFGQVTCTYDPNKGADLPPLKPKEEPEKPPPKPADTAPSTAPGPQPGK
jgi:hypothetical protein